jgi:hypothetical protein
VAGVVSRGTGWTLPALVDAQHADFQTMKVGGLGELTCGECSRFLALRVRRLRLVDGMRPRLLAGVEGSDDVHLKLPSDFRRLPAGTSPQPFENMDIGRTPEE